MCAWQPGNSAAPRSQPNRRDGYVSMAFYVSFAESEIVSLGGVKETIHNADAVAAAADLLGRGV